MEQLTKIKEVLATKFKISKELSPRCYVFPDGDILHLDAYNNHKSVNIFLSKNGYDVNEADSSCQLIEDLGCIRVNLSSEGFIVLSEIQPTQVQYDVLEELLFKYLPTSWGWRRDGIVDLWIFTPKSRGFERHSYNVKTWIPEDIIKVIKRYYTNGVLIEEIED